MLIKEFYPEKFLDMSDGVEMGHETIKDWLEFLEKSEHGFTVSSGNTIAFKNKAGDYIVAHDYKVLPKEIIAELKEESERLEEEVLEFLNDED